MSVRRAKQEIDGIEFAHWVAYYAVEPFGDERADLRQAITSCVMANSFSSKGRRFKPEDFMLREKVQQTPAQMQHIFAHFALAHNRAIKKKG